MFLNQKLYYLIFFNFILTVISSIGWAFCTYNVQIFRVLKFSKSKSMFVFWFSLFSSFFLLTYCFFLWNLFPQSDLTYAWIEYCFPIIPRFNIWFALGLDGVSLLMVLLTAFVMPLSLLTLLDRRVAEVAWMSIALLFLELCLFIAFLAVDMYLFYAAFEAVLIPMFFLIGLSGSRSRRSKAAFYLFFYTLIGSLCMLVGITILYTMLGTSSYDFLVTQTIYCTLNKEYFYFFLFFIAFAVKTPVFPFHLWLPEAHVEAPTTGSIILAGLLLKLGTYGMYRFCIILFPIAAYDFKNFVFCLMIVSMFFTSLAALRQTDMKRVVAYSSIVHMSYCVLGLFSFTEFGIKGSFVLMSAHGLVSSSLFALVGVLYDRYKTRFISYYGGLAYTMPVASVLFFFAVLGNVSFPLTVSFVGELGIFVGAMKESTAPLLLVGVSLFLSTAFSVFLFNRLFFGSLNIKYITVFKDISKIEFFVNYSFLLPVFVLGLFSSWMLHIIDSNLSYMAIDEVAFKVGPVPLDAIIFYQEPYQITITEYFFSLPSVWHEFSGSGCWRFDFITGKAILA